MRGAMKMLVFCAENLVNGPSHWLFRIMQSCAHLNMMNGSFWLLKNGPDWCSVGAGTTLCPALL